MSRRCHYIEHGGRRTQRVDAQRLLEALLADGREAAVFTTPATWEEGS